MYHHCMPSVGFVAVLASHRYDKLLLTYIFYSSLNCLFIHLWHRSYPHLSNSRLRPIYLVCGTAAPCDLFWLDIVKGVPNRSFVSLAGTGFFSVCLLCIGCMQCFVSLFLVVSTSAIIVLWKLASALAVDCHTSLCFHGQPRKNANQCSRLPGKTRL